MTGSQLRESRTKAGLTQAELAARLGKSQAYLSLLESGRRGLSPSLVLRLAGLLPLPPTALPLETNKMNAPADLPEWAADRLASLRYPGYSYRRCEKLSNPAEVLLLVLSTEPLEPRLAEAMPWLLLSFSGFDHELLVRAARDLNIQNRLGFMAALARAVAEQYPEYSHGASELKQLESALEPYRLAREDALGQEFRSERMRSWIRENRTEAAAHWNLLTDLAPEHLPYVN